MEIRRYLYLSCFSFLRRRVGPAVLLQARRSWSP